MLEDKSPRGSALRRALEAQAVSANHEDPSAAEIHMNDLSTLSEADQAKVAKLSVSHGVHQASSSNETSAAPHPASCACSGTGWLWGHELLQPEPYPTDNRYGCDRTPAAAIPANQPDSALAGTRPAPDSNGTAATAATINRFTAAALKHLEDPASKHPSDDSVTSELAYYMAQFERTLHRVPGMRGVRILNPKDFDRSLIELMQYFYAQLPASAAHAGIAAFVRGLLEGPELVAHNEPS